MSASNWAICPRCFERAQAARDEAFQHALSLYGVVPLSEFEAARDAAEAVSVNEDDFRTFREDYEIYGASKGTITVGYSGYCQVCLLKLDFKDEHPFYAAAVSPVALPARTSEADSGGHGVAGTGVQRPT